MINVCRERCIVVNFLEHDNDDLFIVFMIPGNGRFLKGLLKAESRAAAGGIIRFYWADITFVDDENEDADLEIMELKMDQQVEAGPPAF